MNEYTKGTRIPYLLKHIQCCFHCVPLVLKFTLHFLLLLGLKERILAFLPPYWRWPPLRKMPLSLWTQAYQIHLTQLPSALHGGRWNCRDMKEMSPRSLPAPRHPSMPSQGHRETRTRIRSGLHLSLNPAPLTPREGTHIQSPSSASEVQLEQPKGFQGGEGCNRVALKRV